VTILWSRGSGKRVEERNSCRGLRHGGLVGTDKRPLFDLAKRLEDDIRKLQSDETQKWCAEFNSSLALLSYLIRSHLESSEKTADVAGWAAAAREEVATTWWHPADNCPQGGESRRWIGHCGCVIYCKVQPFWFIDGAITVRLVFTTYCCVT
jgi:hypothetical protein